MKPSLSAVCAHVGNNRVYVPPCRQSLRACQALAQKKKKWAYVQGQLSVAVPDTAASQPTPARWRRLPADQDSINLNIQGRSIRHAQAPIHACDLHRPMRAHYASSIAHGSWLYRPSISWLQLHQLFLLLLPLLLLLLLLLREFTGFIIHFRAGRMHQWPKLSLHLSWKKKKKKQTVSLIRCLQTFDWVLHTAWGAGSVWRSIDGGSLLSGWQGR